VALAIDSFGCENEVCSKVSKLWSKGGNLGFGRTAFEDALFATIDKEGVAGVHHTRSFGHFAS
jgi:hypothetical protein